MTSAGREQELSHAMELFHKVMYVDFGISQMNEKIANWYNLSWEEFKNELKKFVEKPAKPVLEDWKTFFHNHKSKILSLKQ